MKSTIKLFTIVTATIILFSSCQKEPTACFEVPASGTVGQSVSFNAACSMDAHHYEWNFGDGGTSMNANPTHQYNTAGVYNVKLKTMSKNSKKMDEVSKSITIN